MDFIDTCHRARQAGWTDATIVNVVSNWWESERTDGVDVTAYINEILDEEEKPCE